MRKRVLTDLLGISFQDVYNVGFTYTFRGGEIHIFPLRRTPLEVRAVTVLVVLIINSLTQDTSFLYLLS
jgi:hypothetical protein